MLRRAVNVFQAEATATATGKNSACSSLVSGISCVRGDAGEVSAWRLVQVEDFRFYSKCSRRAQALQWSMVEVMQEIDVFKDYTGLCMEIDWWKIIAEARKLSGDSCNNLGER